MCVEARPGGPALAVDLELGLLRVVAEQRELLEARLEAELAERVCDRFGSARGLVGARRADADRPAQGVDEVHGA